MRTSGRAARWGTTTTASALLATYLVLTGPPGALGPTVPTAGTTYLCSDYKPCKQAGYPHYGYKSASSTMYWRMYAGHNCTNYVAYRMVSMGMPNVRPWSGGGNASEWGLKMASITDQTPNVNAVAWWGRYSNGSGSAGHVAVVERVVSPDEIIISEDSWGGTFHWRSITRSSGRWPTGFIHFVDTPAPPVPPPAPVLAGTGLPVISGAPLVGVVLSTTAGTWSGDPTGFAYQWLADGEPIPGAVAASYTPTRDLLGKTVAVRVTATRDGATPSVQTSGPTAPLTADGFRLVQPPTVTGELLQDRVLTASPGTWTPTPATTVWRWFADGVRVADNKTSELPLTPEMVGKTISLKVVAKQDDVEKVVSPAFEVGQVLAGVVTGTTPPAIIGTPSVGETLSVTPVTVTPEAAAVTYRWLRNGVPVPDATGTSYQLTPQDAGARMGVEVSGVLERYVPYSATVPVTAPVTSTPAIKLVTKSKKRGRAIARIRVTAPGVAPVPGKVWVKVGRWTGTAKLVDGFVKVVARAARGPRKVKVRYLGSDVVAPAKAKDTVRVR